MESNTYKYRIVKDTLVNGNVLFRIQYKKKKLLSFFYKSYLIASNTKEAAIVKMNQLIELDNIETNRENIKEEDSKGRMIKSTEIIEI